MRFAVVVLLAASSLLAAPVPKDFKKADDKTLLVGKWEVERTIVSGREAVKPNFDHTITFRTDGTAVFEYPNGDKPQVADWTLDPTETPKRLRCQTRVGEREYSFSHRYTFRDGRLVLAWSNGLKSVPLDLAPVPGITVTEYKRANSK